MSNYVGVEFLDHMVSVYLTLQERAQSFFQHDCAICDPINHA